MRIAYLLQQFPVSTQTFAQSDVAALRKNAHDVDIFTLKPRLSGTEVDEDVYRPTLLGALGWLAALWRFKSALPELFLAMWRAALRSPRAVLLALLCLPRAAEMARAIELGRYDVVHLFWARHVAIVLPMLAHARIRTLRSVFVGAYDMVADDFLVTLALRHAQVAFSHAEANRPYLEREVGPQTKIAIVRRGIPLFPLDRGLVRDPALWVTASALIREKNTEGVILAFADGRHLDPSLRLEIYGEGPDRSRLEKRIKSLGLQNAIKFRGHTPREQVFEAMQHADAFLLLSKKRSERLPNAIKEAVWAGCAIVSSNSPGIDELLPNSSIGHVIDPDDEKQVGLAVKEIVHRDRSADFERIAGARALIAERFSAQRTMGEYVACWQRAIASAGACENIAGPGAKPS